MYTHTLGNTDWETSLGALQKKVFLLLFRCFLFEVPSVVLCFGISPTPEKSQRKSPERSLGPPRPRPPKSSEKIRNIRGKVDFNYFLDFADFFRSFWGVGVGGVPNSSRETFLRLCGVLGFWAL